MNNVETHIKVSNLGLSIGSKKILGDVSFEIPKGRFTCIVGANGAGKSSLLKCIAGLTPPNIGHIAFEPNEQKRQFSEDRAKFVAWSPETIDIPFDFIVQDIVLMGRFPTHKGNPSTFDYEKVAEALSLLNIHDLSHRRIHSLSTGELKKVLLAKCLASDNEILLLDEPTANLDTSAKSITLALLKQLTEKGKTVVAVLHDLGDAYFFTDYAAVISNRTLESFGKTRSTITPEAVLKVFNVKSELVMLKNGVERLVTT